MKIIFDNIIFTIQKWGGISVYWNELLKRIPTQEAMTLRLKRPNKSYEKNLNEFKSLSDTSCSFKSTERYLNPHPEIQEKHIFHSSYYRTSRNNKSINITTVHDFTYETHNTGIKRIIHKTQKVNALKSSDGIICISKYTRDLMYMLYPFTRSKNVKVIYNGISNSFLKSKKIKNKIISFNERDYILYIGDRKAKYKNFKFACSLMSKTKKKFVIVGGGDLSFEEKKLLNQIEYKHFPFLSESSLISIYNNAFALLYPSESEGFGIPIIEAQALKCPVISLNQTCIPEISNGHALLFNELKINNFLDGINRISNEKFRSELCDYGLKNALKFSWNNTYNQTIDFYKKMYNLH